jgi:hypothetical protein
MLSAFRLLLRIVSQAIVLVFIGGLMAVIVVREWRTRRPRNSGTEGRRERE